MLRKYITLIIIILIGLLLSPAVFDVSGQESETEYTSQNDYVGSATCSRCHANTYETFKQTWHPNMLRPATDDNILGDFNSQDPDLDFTREEADWVLGGQYKQRYLTEEDGQLFVLLSEWNVETREWSAYVTGEWVPYEGQIWRKRPYAQYCAGCHTTGFNPVTQTWVEPGVGCEACHGPGGDHVASTGNRTKIINPADLEFRKQVEICAQCHSRGEDPSEQFPYPVGYYPGGPAELEETFILTTDPDDFWPNGTAKRHHMQYQDWQIGEHKDSVSCIFCHTSHSVGETDHQTRMVGNDRCVICHEGQTDLAAHIPFMASVADQVNCTDCHMPQISKLVPTDFEILSHTFSPPDPAVSIAYGGFEQMPNACNLCHTDKSPEWAAGVLGQEIPQADATPVPRPTQMPLPTGVFVQAGLFAGEEMNPPETQTGSRALTLWWLGLLAVIVVLAFLWIRRRMNSE